MPESAVEKADVDMGELRECIVSPITSEGVEVVKGSFRVPLGVGKACPGIQGDIVGGGVLKVPAGGSES